MLVQSSPASELQRLCDTVKQGLVLVNGHSFLIGQVSEHMLMPVRPPGGNTSLAPGCGCQQDH
jgi:hypothetical protein